MQDAASAVSCPGGAAVDLVLLISTIVVGSWAPAHESTDQPLQMHVELVTEGQGHVLELRITNVSQVPLSFVLEPLADDTLRQR